MFSFHKPKVYRSTQGCCICKAKSSSSRFTDSKRYEIDFIECFQLDVPRQGEICNACVLLVKRFKRLPPGSERHWGHVVDARVGPGLKSMTKFKKRCEENADRASPTENIKRLKQEVAAKHAAAAAAEAANPQPTSTSTSVAYTSTFVPQKFRKIFRKTKKKKPVESHDENMRRLLTNDFVQQEMIALDKQMRLAEEKKNLQYCGKIKHNRSLSSKRRKDFVPQRNSDGALVSPANELLTANDWNRLKTCCGFVLENRELSALIIDLSTIIVCNDHKQKQQQRVKMVEKKTPSVVQNKILLPTLKKHHLYRALLSEDLQYATPIPAVLTPYEASVTVEKPMQSAGTTATVLDLSGKLMQRVAENNKFSDNSSDSGYEELSSVPDVTAAATPILPCSETTTLGQSVPSIVNYKRSPKIRVDCVDAVDYARKGTETGGN